MLKKDSYLKTVRRPYRPLFASLIVSGLANEKYFSRFVSTPFHVSHLIKSKEIWYFDKKDFNDLANFSFKDLIQKDKFREMERKAAYYGNRMIKASSIDFKEFIEKTKDYMPMVGIFFILDEKMENLMKSLLSDKKVGKAEIERTMDILNIPLKDNFYKKEMYELCNTKNLKDHVKKYEWLLSRYGERVPYTIEMAKKKLSKIGKDKFLRETREEKKKIKETIKYTKHIIGKKNEHIVDLMQFIIFIRTQRTDLINKGIYIVYPFLKRVADSKKISYKELTYCTADEVINDNIPSKKILKEKIKNHVIVLNNGIVSCESGKKAKEINEIFNEKISDIREFKGKSSFIAPNVIGRVKIIKNRLDFKKIKKGDILVTHMTTLDMMPILRIASAFVTDEGGITCHAAIVSRELKKPCIISTKNATSFLKDNDVVEVNTELGVVKIKSKS